MTRILTLALVLLLGGCAAVVPLASAPLRMVDAQEEIEIPGDRPDDADRTYLQCYAGPPEAPSGHFSEGKNGDRVYMDRYGGVSLYRVVEGKPEICLVANWTGGAL